MPHVHTNLFLWPILRTHVVFYSKTPRDNIVFLDNIMQRLFCNSLARMTHLRAKAHKLKISNLVKLYCFSLRQEKGFHLWVIFLKKLRAQGELKKRRCYGIGALGRVVLIFVPLCPSHTLQCEVFLTVQGEFPLQWGGVARTPVAPSLSYIVYLTE